MTVEHRSEFRRVPVQGGLMLNVQVAGWQNTGPVVLLVHGFPDDHTVWRHQVPALVDAGYRVLVPDMRGCGESDMARWAHQYHRHTVAADLVDVLNHFGIEKVRLVGHDWGSGICWTLVCRHPERVDRYCGMSVGHMYAYMHGGWAQKKAGWYTYFFQLRWLAAWLLRRDDFALLQKIFPFPQEWPHIRKRLLRPGRLEAGMRYYIGNMDLLWATRKWPVHVPVLALWSDGDVFLVERQMIESGKFCTKGFRYQRIEGANHWMQLQKPKEVNQLLLGFLRDGL